MKGDTLTAGGLFIVTAIYLAQRNLAHMIVWLGLVYLVSTELGGVSHTVAVLAGIVGIYLISAVTRETVSYTHLRAHETLS
jgi:hypothetical protein